MSKTFIVTAKLTVYAESEVDARLLLVERLVARHGSSSDNVAGLLKIEEEPRTA